MGILEVLPVRPPLLPRPPEPPLRQHRFPVRQDFVTVCGLTTL